MGRQGPPALLGQNLPRLRSEGERGDKLVFAGSGKESAKTLLSLIETWVNSGSVSNDGPSSVRGLGDSLTS